MSRETVARLRARLRGRLRREVVDSSLRHSAVLLMVASAPRGDIIYLTRRSLSVPSHRGEICFPGGKVDDQDPSVAHTAVREAVEELGLDPSLVEVLGVLDDQPTSTGFLITPVVAGVSYPLTLSPNHREVAEVLEVPLVHLLDQANVRSEVRWRGGRPRRRVCYAWRGRIIFGATASILSQFLDIYREVSEGRKRIAI